MFKEKYKNSNWIARWLLNNFFKQVESVYRPVESQIDSILEIGCGHGYSTQKLSRMFENKTFEASDVNEELVKDSKKKNPTLRISKESIYNLEREDSSFDLVVVLEVLEHLESPAPALQELYRISKQYCMISVPDEPLWRVLNIARGSYIKELGNTPGHINHWSKSGIKKLVGKYFEIVTVKSVFPWTLLLVKK